MFDGFGFKLFNEDNVSNVVEFVINNDFLNLSDEEIANLRELASKRDMVGINNELGMPSSWAVAEIINRAEGITLFCGSRDGENGTTEYIGIDQRFPWALNDNDRKYHFDDCRALLSKYAAILGINDEPEYYPCELGEVI